MRIGKRKILAVIALSSAGVAAVMAWILWETSGLLVVLLIVSVGGAMMTIWSVLQTERRMRSQIMKVQKEITSVRKDEHRDFGHIEQSVARLRDSIVRPNEQAEQLLNAIHAAFTRVEIEQERFVGAVQSELRSALVETRQTMSQLVDSSANDTGRLLDAIDQKSKLVEDAVYEARQEAWALFRQIEALDGLYLAARFDSPLPATRDWAASPDLLLFLFNRVRQARPRLVLECGSGVSTVVIAHALRRNGFGRVVSLEHLDRYRDTTLDWIKAHDLEEWVEVRLAPLNEVRIAGEKWPWYAIDQVPEQDIDILFVDGPPGSTRRNARFPALPVLADRLGDGALVVLDDVQREDESSVAQRWADLYPDWQMEVLRHEKGTVAFTKTTVVAESARSTRALTEDTV